jgi:polar amino acid transport system substrate-binding protein
MSAAPQNVVQALAPSGRLRVSINLGNIVLAQTDAKTGEPAGVSAELARKLAERLGLPADLRTFDAAGKVFEAIKRQELDIVFLAVDPVRGQEIAFTPPYALIEGVFMVAANSSFKSMADIDKPGVRVAVARGSAYDLFLTRALKTATLVRSETGDTAGEQFITEKLEAGAGVRQPVVKFMSTHPGFRLIEPPFMEIRQAMGTPKARGDAANAYLHAFIEEMKASGFVADALRRSGQAEVAVAPPEGK